MRRISAEAAALRAWSPSAPRMNPSPASGGTRSRSRTHLRKMWRFIEHSSAFSFTEESWPKTSPESDDLRFKCEDRGFCAVEHLRCPRRVTPLDSESFRDEIGGRDRSDDERLGRRDHLWSELRRYSAPLHERDAGTGDDPKGSGDKRALRSHSRNGCTSPACRRRSCERIGETLVRWSMKA